MVQMEGAAGRRRGVVGGARAHSTDFRTRERQQHFDRRTTEHSLGLGIIILYYFANLPEESMDCAKTKQQSSLDVPGLLARVSQAKSNG